MANRERFTLLEISALREATSVGVAHAATFFSDSTKSKVLMSVPNVGSVSLDDLIQSIGGPEMAVAAVSVPSTGELKGVVAVLFPQEVLDEKSLGALFELGEGLSKAFLDAFGAFGHCDYKADAPITAMDMAGSIVDSVAAMGKVYGEGDVCVKSRIFKEGGKDEVVVLFFPANSALDKVYGKLGLGEAA